MIPQRHLVAGRRNCSSGYFLLLMFTEVTADDVVVVVSVSSVNSGTRDSVETGLTNVS